MDLQTHTAVQQNLDRWHLDMWRYDYFAVMRRLECAQMPEPRWGKAVLTKAESIRIGQEPTLSFAPATFSGLDEATSKRPAILRQRFFGYIGPNGPLPIHLSDFIRERVLHHNDRTWLSFLDSFTHRFALHFYRAWAQTHPAVAMDRPQEDGFRRYIGSLIGIGTVSRQQRDTVHDDARLHFSGWLARQVRCKDGVQAVLGAYFEIPVRLETWVGHWMSLATSDTTRLGLAAVGLGRGTVIGTRVWDRQHRVRLHLGPLNMQQYLAFLPGSPAHRVLSCWMAQLLGSEYEWDARLVLAAKQVPQTRLANAKSDQSRLGWTSWLGNRPRQQDAQDVLIRA
jgi:type VI secretion system protein ImpH